jgi:hypothetical protein
MTIIQEIFRQHNQRLNDCISNLVLNIEEQRKQEFEDFQNHLAKCQEILLDGAKISKK